VRVEVVEDAESRVDGVGGDVEAEGEHCFARVGVVMWFQHCPVWHQHLAAASALPVDP
jgi:hypothetical protein